MERNTKLVLCHHLGKRDANSTDKFVCKLAIATSSKKFQLTCDGFPPYVSAVKIFLPGRVHFAQLVKVYGAASEGEGRYSPAEVIDSVPTIVSGNPVRSRICTSHIERVNLSIRMGMRRMTLLTNGFSKKMVQLGRGVFAVLCLLQLLPRSQDIARNACDGKRFDCPCLEHFRFDTVGKQIASG